MKKIALALLLVLLPVTSQAVPVNPCTEGKEKYTSISTRYTKGLLFEIKKCGVEPNYLLGTMHSDDPKLVEMLDEAFAKLVYSNSASFEIKFDSENINTTLKTMYFPVNSVETLESKVGTTAYRKFVEIVKKLQPDNPEISFYRMKPWAAAVLIQEPPKMADGVALDLKLQKFAEGRKIQVYGLETAEEQLVIFEAIPEDKQIAFFKETVENYDRTEKDNNDIFTAYYEQDLNKLHMIAEKAFSAMSDQEFAMKLKADLVTKRNHKMAKAMIPKLDLGGAFVAVGALHLTGEQGLLKLLEEKGYYINVVEDPGNVMVQ